MVEQEQPGKHERIALAVLKVLFEAALETITPYGKILSTGYQVVDAVNQEFAKDSEREQFKAEILEAVRNLPEFKVVTTAEETLESPGGRQATENFTWEQRADVKQQMIHLTSELNHILAAADQRKEERAREAREWQRLAELERRRRAEQEYERLDELLKTQLNNDDFDVAHLTATKMLEIKPGDPDALKAVRWLERQTGRTFLGEVKTSAGCGLLVAVCFAAFSLYVIWENDPPQIRIKESVYVAIAAVSIVVFFFGFGAMRSASKRRARRTKRESQ